MELRRAQTTDAGACAAIYAPFVTDTAVSFETVPPSPEEMAARITAAQQRHCWLVAVEDEMVLGYAYAGSWRSRPAYQHSCEVSVYVAADRTRQGVGRALYSRLLPLLAEQRFHTLLAGMALPNPASISLHRSLGFAEVGVFREVGRKAGSWHDVLWMQRILH